VLTQQVQDPDAYAWGRRLINQQRGLLMTAALALFALAALVVLACGAWIWAAGTWFVLGNGVYGWV